MKVKKPNQSDLPPKPKGVPPTKAKSERAIAPKKALTTKDPIKDGNKAPMVKSTAIPMPKKEGDSVRIEKIDNGFLAHHHMVKEGSGLKIKTTFHPQPRTTVSPKNIEGGKTEKAPKGKAQVNPLKGDPNPKEIKGEKRRS